ncbi:MAG: MepB family protein [Bacteroidota bacterium]
MNKQLILIKKEIYDKYGFEVSDYQTEQESKEYDACRFKLNGLSIICRSAKITPKKAGQFVSFWKRNNNGIIEPFDITDQLDFYVVNVRRENEFGQFIFPKSELVEKGIITTKKKEGKRAFRVYPSWDNTKSKQAERTQNWQLKYFYKVDHSTDFNKITALYNNG